MLFTFLGLYTFSKFTQQYIGLFWAPLRYGHRRKLPSNFIVVLAVAKPAIAPQPLGFSSSI
jgi:hypothetical protein